MKKLIGIVILIFASSNVHAWKYMTGKIEVIYVNTYSNYSSTHFNDGYCFKLEGQSHYLKLKYAESGEQRNNLNLVQSMVLAAYMSGKELRATYVDWGDDTSCRYNGAPQPAKWLENLQILN